MRISQCVVSTHYLALKYRVNGVVAVVKDDHRMARSCYATAAKETLQVTSLDNRGESKKGRQEPVEKLEEVAVSKSNPSRVVKIGSGLVGAVKGELVNCLQSHADIFVWSHEDMPGIDRGVACHKLAIKKRAWVDELPGVLWAYRTTHKTATRETPFALAFGHETVVPAEIGVGTHRTEYFTGEQNDEQICLNLDLLEEKREGASRKVTQCQQRVTRYYNKNVRVRQFRTGDWVLRKVNQNTRDPNHGALGPKWKSPYRVIRATGPGAYKLAYPNGRDVKRSWNAEHLKKYFQ